MKPIAEQIADCQMVRLESMRAYEEAGKKIDELRLEQWRKLAVSRDLRRKELTRRVLQGETFTEVAKSIGVTDSAVQVAVRKYLREHYRDTYGGRVWPIQELRANRCLFGC